MRSGRAWASASSRHMERQRRKCARSGAGSHSKSPGRRQVMRKLRLKPPANDRRPVRRSLVELTEAASRAADEGVVMMPSSLVMISPDIMPRLEEAAAVPARTVAPRKAAPRVAKAAAEPPPRAAALPQSGSAAEMLAQIAKDQQARALDNIRLGFAAALDYAKD